MSHIRDLLSDLVGSGHLCFIHAAAAKHSQSESKRFSFSKEIPAGAFIDTGSLPALSFFPISYG